MKTSSCIASIANNRWSKFIQPKLMYRKSVTAPLFAFAFLAASHSVKAQCTTFQNADAANPVLSVLPANQTITSLDFVDINGDGKKDCYVVPQTGIPQLYVNDGSKTKPEFKHSNTSGFENITTPEGSPVIQFVDIDNDGDEDCFISEIDFGFRPITTIRFYRNEGNGKQPKFVEDEENNPVSFARTDYNFVYFTFADIDKDGDEDFFYTGLYNRTANDYDQFTYLNNGTKETPSYTLYSTENPHDFERQRTYVDWNNDGLLDYIKFDVSLNKYSFVKNVGPYQKPTYQIDNNAPHFDNGMPYRLVDLNGDSSLESFTATGHYATLAPVSVLTKTEKKIGGQIITELSSAFKSREYEYQWQINGTKLPFNIPTAFAFVPGKYVLYVKNACGTGISLPYEVGKKGNNIESGDMPIATSGIAIKAYPNPFVNDFTIQLPSGKIGGNYTIKMMDAAGKLVLTKTTSSSTVHVAEKLNNGLYLLQILQNGSVVYRTTILKQ